MKSRFKSFLNAYWTRYSIIFIVLSALVFRFFLADGHSLINHVDGFNQNYASLLFYSQHVRALIRGGGTTGVPSGWFDYCIGFGDETISTIWLYLGISPLTLFSFLCPDRFLDYFYSFDVLFRIYLAGLGFSVFARSHSKSDVSALVGSICYCFCGFVLQKGIQHVNFLMPMFFLPLILAGVDKIIRGEKPYLYTVCIALCAMNNFYFFYMIAIAVVLYVFAQLLIDSKPDLKSVLQRVGCVALWSIVGFMLSAIILIPILYSMMGSSRIGSVNSVSILYPLLYYFRFAFGFMTNAFNEYDTRTGYTAVSLIACILLLSYRGHRKLKIAFGVMTAFLLIPFFGSAFNGFGYVSNRWIFIYSLLIAYITTAVIDDDQFMQILSKDMVRRIIVTALVYAGVFSLLVLLGLPEDFMVYRSLLVLGIVSLVMILVLLWRRSEVFIQRFILGITMVCIVINAWEYYSPTRGAAVNSYMSYGEAYGAYVESWPTTVIDQLSDSDMYRVSIEATPSNSMMIYGVRGMDFYFSTVVDSVNSLMREMEYNNALEHQYGSFDDRYILESLCGHKYSVRSTEEAYNDALYDSFNVDDDQFLINRYAVPVVYTYDTYIPRDVYAALSPEDKQESMLYGAVVDDLSHDVSRVEKYTYKPDNYEIAYTSDDIAMIGENHSLDFVNLEQDREIVLQLDQIPEQAEIYVIFEGIKYTDIDPMSMYGVKWTDRGEYPGIVKSAQFAYIPNDSVGIEVRMGDVCRDVNYKGPTNRMYAGRNSFLCNLGYVDQADSEITLVLKNAGVYQVDDIRIVAQPIAPVIKALDKLGSAGGDVRSWSFEKDRMIGTVETSEDKILCITVPYSKGWHMYVDGEESDIMSVNTAFMGTVLSTGMHEVELVYTVPYLSVAIVLTIIAVLLIAAYALYGRYRCYSIH